MKAHLPVLRVIETQRNLSAERTWSSGYAKVLTGLNPLRRNSGENMQRIAVFIEEHVSNQKDEIGWAPRLWLIARAVADMHVLGLTRGARERQRFVQHDFFAEGIGGVGMIQRAGWRQRRPFPGR